MQIMLYYAHQQFGPKLAANYHKITALKVVSHVKPWKSYWNAENLFFYCLPWSKISTIFGRWRDQPSQKIVLLLIASKFGPQEVNRFSQLCAKFQALGSFELHATIFSNLVKMALPSGRILSRLLRRMKAFIDEFRPNTSQANYFGGFWRITSEINAKIEVIKQ